MIAPHDDPNRGQDQPRRAALPGGGASFRRLAWATDIHLEFCKPPARFDFYQSIIKERPEALLLGGDLSDGNNLEHHLYELEKALPLPIFFVLGNHDCYHASIGETERLAAEVAGDSRRLRFLPEEEPIELAPGIGLIGHGGWADGRCGDYDGSTVQISDFLLIEEFAGLGKEERLNLLNTLGDISSAWFREALPRALSRFDRLLVLTHVPPFPEAAWYQGKISEPDYLPFFAAQAVGEALLEAMRAHPDKEMLVLCGHTHGGGEARILPNLRVLTGAAEYHHPRVQKFLDLSECWKQGSRPR